MSNHDLCIILENNCKAIITADITLYFNDISGLSEGLNKALKHVLPLLAPHVRWYRTEAMTRDKKTTSKLLDAVPGWFNDRFPEREEYGLILNSGDTPDDVGPWGMDLYIEPDFLGTETGHLQISLPTTELSPPSNLLNLTHELANLIPFRSGHAGYGVIFEEGDIDPDLDTQMRGWFNRYQGLDARDLTCTGANFSDAIKGVGWLTLIDSKFVQKLGGISTIQSTLPSGITIKEVNHGLIIQAGSEPILGDKNRKEDISDLKVANELIKPIRIEDDIDIRAFGDADGTREWIERFDD